LQKVYTGGMCVPGLFVLFPDGDYRPLKNRVAAEGPRGGGLHSGAEDPDLPVKLLIVFDVNNRFPMTI